MNKSTNLYLNEINRAENKFGKIIFDKLKSNKIIDSNQDKFTLLREKIKEKIASIQSLEIPHSELELIDTLHVLQNHLYISGWKSVFYPHSIKKSENKWNNELSDCILSKYKEALLILETNFPNHTQITEFRLLAKKLIFKKILETIGIG